MVELKPVEFEALVGILGGGRLGEEELDRVTEQCESTAAFWKYLTSYLRPDEQQRLDAALSRSLSPSR